MNKIVGNDYLSLDTVTGTNIQDDSNMFLIRNEYWRVISEEENHVILMLLPIKLDWKARISKEQFNEFFKKL